MGDHDLIVLVTALVSALGLKEVWGIIKKKMDLDGKKAELKSERKVTYEATKDQITAQVIEELKNKIGELEAKIDSLIAENIQLREKLARMEERILVNAKNKVGRRKKSTENKEK
jgi:predicted RNase H-like nuclease (RuvC/YqgF family)